MNKSTKILFTTLFFVVAIAAGNALLGFSPATNKTEQPEQKEHISKSASLTSVANASFPANNSLLMQHAKKDGILLKRTAYTLSYDKDAKLPTWVAWHLTSAHTNGPYKRDGLDFTEDEDVPQPRATKADYVQSGYDRGHMCPSGDNKWSQRAQLESFIYTNCCPQLHNLNSGDWGELEKHCRIWAKEYGDIYIVCGPVLFNKKHKTIGRHKVVVPEAFYKVVLRIGKTIEDTKAIGFIYRNEVTNKPMKSYVNTVDQVERITGIDFFPTLPDEIENEVEASADINDWK